MTNRQKFGALHFMLALTVGSMGNSAQAQELLHGPKPTPDFKDVAAMIGQPVTQMFSKFGAPLGLSIVGAKTKSPALYIDYGYFEFKISESKVAECSLGGWPGPVMGVKVGSKADDIVKTMGKPREDVKNADGTEEMFWDSSDNKYQISITYDKNQVSNGFFLSPKESK
jgi:hypothetical protein